MRNQGARKQGRLRATAWTSVLCGALALLVIGCGSLASRSKLERVGAPEAREETEVREETVILVSIDGFRWDYVDRPQAESFGRLAREGVRAERLIPSFPTKTFPNHYTLVTGLSPGNHGIVANTMYDPEFDATFSLSNRAAVSDGRWWGGEPIWVTAERQGLTTAAFFWPGSEAEIGGFRPTFWRPYAHETPHKERVDQVLEWLSLPAMERPRFITLYFSTVDSAGHDFGPAPGTQLDAVLEEIDATLASLIEGLETLSSKPEAPSVNLILVSDHGMSATASDRVILLDDYIALGSVEVVDWNPVAALIPKTISADDLVEQLSGAHPHLSVYRRAELPEHWSYRDHRRVAPVIAVADGGWSIAGRERYERCPECYDGGNHGYAPDHDDMGGLFVAWGPAFAAGVNIPAFENVHIYELLCHLLQIEPATNEGSLTPLTEALEGYGPGDRLERRVHPPATP